MPIYRFEIQRVDKSETEEIEVGADDEWQAFMVIAQAHPGAQVIRKLMEYPRHIKPATA